MLQCQQNMMSNYITRYNAVWYNIVLHITAATLAEYTSQSEPTTHTPSYGMFCEDFGENKLHYIGTALYHDS